MANRPITKFFAMLWLKYLRNFWSMIRWNGKRKEVSREMISVNDGNLKSTLKDVYSHYQWAMDDVSQLFDSMRPAPYLYNQYLEAKLNDKVVEDDCDGYHTIIYHMLKNNGYRVALITLVTDPISQSHTMVAIKDIIDDGTVSYRVVNYTAITGPYITLEKFVEQYKHDVICWSVDKYDYDGRRFRNISVTEF